MIIKLCFVLSALVTAKGSLNISYEDIVPSDCIIKILSRITNNKNSTTDVSLINVDDAVVKHLQGIKGLRFITRSKSYENDQIHNTVYVMNFEDYSEMLKTFDIIMQDDYWTPLSYFIIIIQHIDYDLVKMKKFLIFNNLYNVTILMKNAGDYTIFGFQSPIRPCDYSPQLLKIAHCLTYTNESKIFPWITKKNIRGCHFKFAAKNFYPMVDFDNNKSQGLEQRMVKIFGERYNLTIDLVEYYKIDKLGRIVGNYSYVDMLKMVSSNKVEGAFGGYFIDVAYIGKFSYAYPLRIDHIVLIMPKANFYDTWHAVILENFYVFMFILSLVIIFSASAYFLGLFPSREADATRDFLIIIGYFLNKITVRKLKNGTPESLIIGSLLFSVLILPYSIQAFFYSVKTNPKRGFEVQDSKDITDKYQMIVPLDLGKVTANSKSQICMNRLDCLNMVMKCADRLHYTIIGETMYLAYKWMLIDEQCSADVYKLRDPVMSKLRTVYFRSGSVLVKPFDKFTLNYVSSGLLQKHFSDMVFKERLKCRYRAKPNHKALGLKDVKYSFALLALGSFLSVICFAYEVVTGF